MRGHSHSNHIIPQHDSSPVLEFNHLLHENPSAVHSGFRWCLKSIEIETDVMSFETYPRNTTENFYCKVKHGYIKQIGATCAHHILVLHIIDDKWQIEPSVFSLTSTSPSTRKLSPSVNLVSQSATVKSFLAFPSLLFSLLLDILPTVWHNPSWK